MMTSKTLTIIATLAVPALLLAMQIAAAQGADAPPPPPPPASDGPTRPGSTMYRWVDQDKTVHYSDRPQPGAEAVPVQAPQTYSAPKAPPVRASAARATSTSLPPAATCGITSPSAEQVFPNAQSLMISYRGPTGGNAELLLNGESKQTVPAGQAFTISPVPRGAHSATVAITSDTGAVLCRTPSVTFYVTQPSLLSPVRQQMNRRAPR